MGIADRKSKEIEMKRNDIIDAAERIFFKYGYQSTMDDIAKEAEFSKRTVYVYFKSKEEIYFEIMIRGYQLLNAVFDEKLNTVFPSEIEKIKHMGTLLFDFNMKYPEYFNAIMQYENSEKDFEKGVTDTRKEVCYLEGEKLLSHLIQAINQGINEGSIISDIDIIQTAIMIWACTLGIFNTAKKKELYIKNYFQIDIETFIKNSFELLLKSISK